MDKLDVRIDPNELMRDIFLQPATGSFCGVQLDELLAQGYYRAGPYMARYMKSVNEYDGDKPIYTLLYKIRIDLHTLFEAKKTQSILRKGDGFQVAIGEPLIDEETEELYTRYHAHVDFISGDTCRECLHDTQREHPNGFDSYRMTIRDEGKLIAAGYFDRGERSAMGILNIYDPDYKAFSLGKLLMLRKMEMLRKQGIRYFYPGSVFLSANKMDYKMFTGPKGIELLIPWEQQWYPHEEWRKQDLAVLFYRTLLNAEVES